VRNYPLLVELPFDQIKIGQLFYRLGHGHCWPRIKKDNNSANLAHSDKMEIIDPQTKVEIIIYD